MEKYTVAQLKEIIKNHKKTNCPAISRKRKNELLEIIKILNIYYNKMEKYTVIQLKEIIKNHKKINCPAISKKRKNELLEIIKILNIELPVKMIEQPVVKVEKEKKPKKIEQPVVKVEKEKKSKKIKGKKKLPPLLINNVSEGSYSDLRFINRNHPALLVNEALRDIKKHLFRGDYEDEIEEKEAKKDIKYLEKLIKSDHIYDVYDSGKSESLPLYEWNRKGKFNRATNRME